MTKPTADELAQRLGIDLADLDWRTSGSGEGMFQIATLPGDDGRVAWVLVRLSTDASDVQVYDRREWSAFVDGAKRGEFDDLL